jgi:hypothetical protein
VDLWEAERDWQLTMYLGRKLGAALPEPLAQAVAIRKKRAAAFACVFWKAGRYAADPSLVHSEVGGEDENSQTRPAAAERMATWDVMSWLPEELREHIALEAHLFIL